jgi:hypothetical protein
VLVARRQDRLEDKPSGQPVFAAPSGGPWTVSNLRQRYWRPAPVAAQLCPLHLPADAYGELSSSASACSCPGRLHVRPRFHDLRHSHVAQLIAAGWDSCMIQLRSGRASIRATFDTYGHVLPHVEHERLAALDAWLAGAPLEVGAGGTR